MINILIDGLDDIEKACNRSIEEFTELTLQAMARIGEIYANTAKENGSYQNRTGNLRNSNGYGIAEDGELKTVVGNEDFKRGLIGQDLSGDIVLVAGAVMDYASDVQRKGYDVTDSGQLAAENLARQLL